MWVSECVFRFLLVAFLLLIYVSFSLLYSISELKKENKKRERFCGLTKKCDPVQSLISTMKLAIVLSFKTPSKLLLYGPVEAITHLWRHLV